MRMIEEIIGHSRDPEFVSKFMAVKLDNKRALQKYVEKTQGIHIRLDAMYDVMVKRIHEYKRQHMNIFYVIHRYFEILSTPES